MGRVLKLVFMSAEVFGSEITRTQHVLCDT